MSSNRSVDPEPPPSDREPARKRTPSRMARSVEPLPDPAPIPPAPVPLPVLPLLAAVEASLSPPRPAWVAKVKAMSSERAQRWSSALRALDAINAQATVADLLADPDPELDYLVQPALETAQLWIQQLHKGYRRGQ